MRTLATLAILLVGLPFVFGAPAAKAHCPHNGDDTNRPLSHAASIGSSKSAITSRVTVGRI